MANPTLISLLPFLLGWLAWRLRRQGQAWLEPAVVALGVMVLCCVPWTIRNYVAFDAFVPMRANLGVQLWCGNNDGARDLWLGEGHPIHDSAERARYIELGEIGYEHEKRNEALNYMVTHPRRELHLTWVRFVTFWSGGTPTPIADFIRKASQGFRFVLWFGYVLCFNILTAVGALAGIIILIARRSGYAFPLAVFPLVLPWAYYLTIVEPRYRQPIDSVVMLLSAIALSPLLSRADTQARA
jgi:hypothetical protein